MVARFAVVWAVGCFVSGCAEDDADRDADDTRDAADGEVTPDAPDVPDMDAPDTGEPDGAETSPGDGVEPGDDVDSAAPDGDTGGDGDGTDGDADVRVPRCGDGVLDDGEACDDGDRDDLDGCDRDCAASEVVRAPRPGEVVFTELMVDPVAVPDPRGEWIELVSLSGDALNLSGCTLVDDGTDRVALDVAGGRVLAPGALFLAAGDEARDPDVRVTNMLLDDLADEVALVCDGVEIDRVAWVPFAWPIIPGRALSLDPTRRDAADNDVVESWCPATASYGGSGGDRGTPGAANPACAHLDRAVDRCRLLGDASARGFADTGAPFEVEVEELGLTDLTTSVDVSPELLVEVGSAAGAPDPNDSGVFTWVRAAPKAGFVAAPDAVADVWVGSVVAPEGTRRVMARASRDGGVTWRLCDRDGSDDGVSLDQLATLVVGPSPCATVTCDDPPEATCGPDGVRRDGFEAIGVCIPSEGAGGGASFRCEYAPLSSDCGALGRVCQDGGAGGAVCGDVPRTPVLGEVVFNELMVRPTAPFGQWIELRSTADEPLLLTGCALSVSDGVDTFTWPLEAPTVVGPGGLIVLGESDVFDENGGVIVARTWGDALGDDGLPTLATAEWSCGEVLDVVAWDTSWPGIGGEPGASASLSPLRGGPGDNDLEDGWCRATDTFGAGDRGTPGGPNPTCPGDVSPVEACSLVGAVTASPPAGTSTFVTVRVIARTWTSRTLRTDPNAKLLVEVGYAAKDAGADAVASWTGSTANTAWLANGAGVDAAEDRYDATFRAPAPGAWDLYARATADGGNTWAVCDTVGILASPDAVGTPLRLTPTPSVCSPDPCDESPPLTCRPVANGSPVEVLAATGPATCTVVSGAPFCAYAETVVENCAARGAVCAETAGGAACAGFPRTPARGEVIFSELLIAAGNLELGEWLELQNTSDDALDLRGCRLQSKAPGNTGTKETWTFGTPTTPLGYVLEPREAVVVARNGSSSINGNVQPITVYEDVALDNDEDYVELVCKPALNDVVIDNVTWKRASGWVIPFGTSLQLSGAKLDASSNDFARNFCAPGVTSPRQENRVCPGDGVVDDCRVQAATASAVADTPFAVSLVVSDPGVTDVRPTVDPAVGMLVEVGIGPDGVDPMTSFDWYWVELDPDAAWDDRSGGGPVGWDRWVGMSAMIEVATRRMLGRVSLDGGASWTLCGATGIADGPEDGRSIVGRAHACNPNPCTTPPAASCNGSSLNGWNALGTCNGSSTNPCSYSGETFSCASYGGCSAQSASAGNCNAVIAKPAHAGDLVISEVMRDSTAPAPDAGEWVEVYNPTTTPFDLRGCELSASSGGRTTVVRGIPDVIAPSGHAVFAKSGDSTKNGGIPTALGKPRTLGPLVLGNGADTLTLRCSGVVIDTLAWSFGWPGQSGVAMQLDRAHLGAADNDLRASWCAASPGYGLAGNKGSPGSLNPTCP